jgi:hypothetical protein
VLKTKDAPEKIMYKNSAGATTITEENPHIYYGLLNLTTMAGRLCSSQPIENKLNALGEVSGVHLEFVGENVKKSLMIRCSFEIAMKTV